MSYIPSSDFMLEIQKGNVPGHKMWNILGEREAIGTAATGEDMWLGTSDIIPTPSPAGEQMTLVSASTADTDGGTGVTSVFIHYIDSNGDEQEETVTMNGTAGANTVATDIIHVNHFHSMTVGAGGVAAGHITIHKLGAASTVYSIIRAGGNMDLTCKYMVPAGHKLLLTSWHAEISSNDRVSMRLRSTDHHGTLIPGVYCFKGVAYLAKTTSGQLSVNATVPGGSVIKISAFADQSDADASCGCHGVLVQDGY